MLGDDAGDDAGPAGNASSESANGWPHKPATGALSTASGLRAAAVGGLPRVAVIVVSRQSRPNRAAQPVRVLAGGARRQPPAAPPPMGSVPMRCRHAT
jgi:hypothetical protein